MSNGTNFFGPALGTVQVALADEAGLACLIKCTAANLPTGAGYAIGCMAFTTDAGTFYTNTGTATVASFSLISASAVTLPSALTDASTTTGTSLSLAPSTATSGNGLRITCAGLTSGVVGNFIASTANFTTGGSVVKADLVAAVAGNGLVTVTTGIYVGTGLLSVTASSATTGVLALLSGAGLTTGTALSIVSAEANLTSGKYINAGGVFTVAKYGATVITGNASGTAALTLTAGDVLITSGGLTLTANASVISFTGTGTNGGLLKNLYNDTASALSGTQKDIKIMIGATPYYFTVYPTKA